MSWGTTRLLHLRFAALGLGSGPRADWSGPGATIIEDGRAGPAMIAAGAAQQRDEADNHRQSPPLRDGSLWCSRLIAGTFGVVEHYSCRTLITARLRAGWRPAPIAGG